MIKNQGEAGNNPGIALTFLKSSNYRVIVRITFPSGSTISTNMGIWPNGMGGAGQAGIMRADGGFNPVEHAFVHLRALDIGFGDAINRFAHRPVVMAGGDDQVDTFDLAVRLQCNDGSGSRAGLRSHPRPHP